MMVVVVIITTLLRPKHHTPSHPFSAAHFPRSWRTAHRDIGACGSGRGKADIYFAHDRPKTPLMDFLARLVNLGFLFSWPLQSPEPLHLETPFFEMSCFSSSAIDNSGR